MAVGQKSKQNAKQHKIGYFQSPTLRKVVRARRGEGYGVAASLICPQSTRLLCDRVNEEEMVDLHIYCTILSEEQTKGKPT